MRQNHKYALRRRAIAQKWDVRLINRVVLFCWPGVNLHGQCRKKTGVRVFSELFIVVRLLKQNERSTPPPLNASVV